MRRTVYAVWNGGSNYSPGEIDRDLEVFTSIKAAGEALTERAATGHWRKQHFELVNREPADHLTPNADADPTMTIWFYNPTDVRDPHPDRRLSIGPRGGLKQETT